MIKVYRWSAEQACGTWLEADALVKQAEELRATKDVVWIDLDNPDAAEEKLVFEQFFPIHPLSLEDVTHLKRKPDKPPHFPKVEEFPDYLFVIVNPLVRRLLENLSAATGQTSEVYFENGRTVTQLTAVLTHTLLITHHYGPVQGIEELRDFLCRHTGVAQRGPDYLFHIILDEMVDEYAPVLDHFAETLEEYEEQMFTASKEMLKRMIERKRAIIVLRKTLIYEREILARLCRGEFNLIDERETVYYRNVYDHLLRFTELIEASREMVSDLLQLHLAASGNRLNEVMKVLTMISTTVLPMTLIAGIYGMNYDKEFFPSQESGWGFGFALAMMVLSGLSSFLFFRWKKWI